MPPYRRNTKTGEAISHPSAASKQIAKQSGMSRASTKNDAPLAPATTNTTPAVQPAPGAGNMQVETPSEVLEYRGGPDAKVFTPGLAHLTHADFMAAGDDETPVGGVFQAMDRVPAADDGSPALPRSPVVKHATPQLLIHRSPAVMLLPQEMDDLNTRVESVNSDYKSTESENGLLSHQTLELRDELKSERTWGDQTCTAYTPNRKMLEKKCMQTRELEIENAMLYTRIEELEQQQSIKAAEKAHAANNEALGKFIAAVATLKQLNDFQLRFRKEQM